MKKISYPIVALLTAFFAAAPSFTLAAIEQLENPTKVNTLQDFIKEILTIVVKIGIPVATIFIIWSGFLFLTAQGDETQLKKAKTSFVWAVVGTAVLLGSWLLATAIKSTIDQL